MGMDWRTVDTLGAGRWTLNSTEQCGRRCSSVARLRAGANLPVLWYQHGGARMRSIIRVCGPPSAVSSLASLGSPVSRVQFPLSGVECRHVQPWTQARTWRPASLTSCALGLEIDGHHTGLFLAFVLLLTDCRLAPARLAK